MRIILSEEELRAIVREHLTALGFKVLSQEIDFHVRTPFKFWMSGLKIRCQTLADKAEAK